MKKLILMLAIALISFSGLAQAPGYISDGGLLDGKTIIKANLTSLVLSTGGFSAERILGKNLSGVLSVSFMPSTSIPFYEMIAEQSGADAQTLATLSSVSMNTFSFSPELRIYTGRGYGRGFYLSPYYRYEKFGLDKMNVNFEDNNGTIRDIMLNGGVKTHSGGLLLGYQWLVGKKRNIVIDWNIFGIHYGVSSGNFHGIYNGTLTEQERADAQQSIDDTFADLPVFNAKGTVNQDNTVDVLVDGPWAFLRGSLSVGFRF